MSLLNEASYSCVPAFFDACFEIQNSILKYGRKMQRTDHMMQGRGGTWLMRKPTIGMTLNQPPMNLSVKILSFNIFAKLFIHREMSVILIDYNM